MFGIGMPELLVILGLALILLGPKRLPQLARSLGKTMNELRKAGDELKESIAEEIKPIKDDLPDKEELKEALKKKFFEGGHEDAGDKADKGRQTS